MTLPSHINVIITRYHRHPIENAMSYLTTLDSVRLVHPMCPRRDTECNGIDFHLFRLVASTLRARSTLAGSWHIICGVYRVFADIFFLIRPQCVEV